MLTDFLYKMRDFYAEVFVLRTWRRVKGYPVRRGYAPGSVIDPTGRSTGSARVKRGWSWNSDAKYCRSAPRTGGIPTFRSHQVGFRALP